MSCPVDFRSHDQTLLHHSELRNIVIFSDTKSINAVIVRVKCEVVLSREENFDKQSEGGEG